MTLSSEDQQIINQGKVAISKPKKNGSALTRTAKEVTELSQSQLQALSDDVATQALPVVRQLVAEKLAKGVVVSMPETLEEAGGILRDFLPKIFDVDNTDLMGDNPLELMFPEAEA